VAAAHVADLAAEQGTQLVVVELLHRRRADHDERPVHADGPAVDQRRLVDVQLGQFGHVERGGGLGEAVVHPRVLPVVDPDRAGQVRQPEPPLVPQAEEAAYHLVEAA
jgi:hypothetical protein